MTFIKMILLLLNWSEYQTSLRVFHACAGIQKILKNIGTVEYAQFYNTINYRLQFIAHTFRHNVKEPLRGRKGMYRDVISIV